MHILIGVLLLLLLLFGPQLWVQAVLKRHSQPRGDFPGTGGEFARHLLDRLQLENIQIEASDAGDHYDPAGKVVRLTPEKLNGRSLTAITVAAHEVGHAIQHATSYAALAIRNGLVPMASIGGNISVFLIIGGAVLMAMGMMFGKMVAVGGLALFGTVVAFQLINLPVEFNASSRARARRPPRSAPAPPRPAWTRKGEPNKRRFRGSCRAYLENPRQLPGLRR